MNRPSLLLLLSLLLPLPPADCAGDAGSSGPGTFHEPQEQQISATRQLPMVRVTRLVSQANLFQECQDPPNGALAGQPWWIYPIYALLGVSTLLGLACRMGARRRGKPVPEVPGAEEPDKERRAYRQVELELQAAERRLSLALDASPQGFWEYFPQRGECFFSPGWFAMLGYAADELPHRYQSWADLLHPDNRSETEQGLRTFLAEKGQDLSLEFRLRARDGGYRWIQASARTVSRDENGEITQMICLQLDITEQKLREAQLVACEQRYRELFDEAPVMYVIIENRNQQAWIRDANNAFLETLGYRRSEVQHTLLSTYYSPASRSHILRTRNYEQIVSRAFLPEERELLTRDGRSVHCLMYASPELAADGTVSTLRTMFLDITLKKKAEEEKLRLESALQQAQKMEAIGTLAGGIAHDFNNILAAIIGYCELLLLDLPKESPDRSKIEQIHLAGLRARDLVQQILTFSRRSERKLEPLQVAPVIREALNLVRSTLPASINIREEIGENLPNITADPTQIHQIVMNLCTNSAQAMPEGGQISITLDTVDIPAHDSRLLPQNQPGRHLRLVVADTGEGIRTDLLQNIFTPYFTTKAKTQGTGLGLAVVHGIVQGYGGTIDVRSSPGKGTVFTLLIPATTRQSHGGAGHASLPGGSREHILLVDDEPMLVDVGRQLLAALGYQVTAVASSLEALALFQADPGHYDMLISDMTMPEMTGERLAAEVKAERPDLPVILVTGFSEKLAGQDSKELGIEGLLFKPVEKAELANAINTIFSNRSTERP